MPAGGGRCEARAASAFALASPLAEPFEGIAFADGGGTDGFFAFFGGSGGGLRPARTTSRGASRAAGLFDLGAFSLARGFLPRFPPFDAGSGACALPERRFSTGRFLAAMGRFFGNGRRASARFALGRAATFFAGFFRAGGGAFLRLAGAAFAGAGRRFATTFLAFAGAAFALAAFFLGAAAVRREAGPREVAFDAFLFFFA